MDTEGVGGGGSCNLAAQLAAIFPELAERDSWRNGATNEIMKRRQETAGSSFDDLMPTCLHHLHLSSDKTDPFPMVEH